MWITKCGVEEESVDKLKPTLPIGDLMSGKNFT